MQTWITDRDYKISASNLDRQRLGAQIYEGIHILSSLLGVNDKLITPKRSVANHPVAKFWKGCEAELYTYICDHLLEWYNRGYKSDINFKNIIMLYQELSNKDNIFNNPKITDDLIRFHKSILIKKNPEFYSKIFEVR